MWAAFFSFWAFLQASLLETHGFAWWRVGSIFLFGLVGGIWIAQIPPIRRLMAWRARKYGGVPVGRGKADGL